MNTDRSTAADESQDPAFCARLRAQLEAEANALDAVTAARLAAARQRALAGVAQSGGAKQGAGTRWLPWLGSAVAASLLLAVVLGRGSQAPPVPAPMARSSAVAAVAPEALIASDVAVIADLEFYDWLEEQDAAL